MDIKVGLMHFRELNDRIVDAEETYIKLEDCIGQRYIACGSSNKQIDLYGTPGNALGAYLDGSTINVYGNVQEATGDTMNEGNIYVYGTAGDATGYSMRGGNIFVKEDAGYRAGIHMKAYETKIPALVIGGKAGSFLGEYQAGGTIVVLGLNTDETPVGNFCGTGMHGGKIYIRTENPPENLGHHILVQKATQEDLGEIKELLQTFEKIFNISYEEIHNKSFYVLIPDTQNPYKQIYSHH